VKTCARRRKEKGEPEVPVNAFSDIAFLLIIFFIVATTITKLTGVLTNMPAGEKTEAKADKNTSVQLHDDKVTLNGDPVDMPALRKRLFNMHLDQKKGEDKVVLLEAVGNVTYQVYFEAMATINGAGGVIAIVQEEKSNGKGS